MIALAGRVVESDHPLAPGHERPPVLESVPAPPDRRIRHAPDDESDERIRGDDVPIVEEQGVISHKGEGTERPQIGPRYCLTG